MNGFVYTKLQPADCPVNLLMYELRKSRMKHVNDINIEGQWAIGNRQ